MEIVISNKKDAVSEDSDMSVVKVGARPRGSTIENQNLLDDVLADPNNEVTLMYSVVRKNAGTKLKRGGHLSKIIGNFKKRCNLGYRNVSYRNINQAEVKKIVW